MSCRMADDGHEPKELDRDLVTETVRAGGAIVRVEVREAGKVWRSEKLIPAGELRSAHIDLIAMSLHDALDMWVADR